MARKILMAERRFLLYRAGVMALCALLAGAAHAQESVSIELGTAVTQEDAHADWRELRRKFPPLAKLKFAPLPFGIGGGEKAYRLRADPVPKAQAFRICAAMLAEDYECFVARASGDKPVASAPARRKTIDFTKPPEMQETSGPVTLPWLTAETAPEPQDTTAEGKPRVDVAEAIRVPLTRDRRAAGAPRTVQMQDIPAPRSTEAGWTSAGLPPEEPQAATLRIGDFTDEQAAIGFWRALQRHMPQESASWRAHTVMPLIRRPPSRATLTLAPATDLMAVQRACDFAHRHAAGLECRLHDDAAPPAPLGEPRYQYRLANAPTHSAEALALYAPPLADAHSDDERRERYVQRRIRPETPAPSQALAQEYWAQLGTARSRAQAARDWGEWQRKYPALLENRRLKVLAAPGTSVRHAYRLRTGPFESRKAVEAFCASLERKSLPCAAAAAP